MNRLFLLLTSILLLAVVTVGCDATGGGGDTITLTTTEDDTQLDPITYTFEYNQDDVNEGQVTVSAFPDEDAPSLEGLLQSRAAASLSDIVSARVTRVRIRSVSPTTDGRLVPKVLPYIARTELYLGGTGGAPVAREPDVPTTAGNSFTTISLGAGAEDVTDSVKGGTPEAILIFDVDDPDSVGNPDRVAVEISYSLEVASS